MIMRLLDTNIVSYWMRGDKTIISRLMTFRPFDLAISAITLAEILYGIEKSPVRKQERRQRIDSICSQLEVIVFDEHAAETYGIIRARLERNGTPISERDLQIASIGLAGQYIVVTHNTKEFERIAGLAIEDWAQGEA
ncbi:MAG: type II toxin-antitoxin system VapC family toxin [Desulfosalsimonadaceae bacterium]|nr:type II toxin-antitoxin system VapC family toxin [Desulfosalsimonadaceae bacterium]